MRFWVVYFIAFASIGFISGKDRAKAQVYFDMLDSKPGQPLPTMPGYGLLNPKAKAEQDRKYEREQAAKPVPQRESALSQYTPSHDRKNSRSHNSGGDVGDERPVSECGNDRATQGA